MGSEKPLIREDTGEESARCASACVRAGTAWQPIDSVTYRNFTIDVFEDPYGNQFRCMWKGKWIEFGTDNTLYIDDIKSLIDDEVDTVCRWEEFPGAKLTWFQNGDHRDLKLVNWGRILKVYLVEDPSKVNLTACVCECVSLLKYIVELEEK